tara:strand:- start:20 stop:706 length:687 start_codon:yes stop_codon:yes gene_type:complete
LYKVIFNSITSTQDEIIGFSNYKKILENNNLYIQSFTQIKGTGRGKKKWLSPKGNIYLTINQKLKASYALRNNFYICYLIHKFFKINFNINLDYKWPNDLFFNNKKIVGVVVKSTILGKRSYLKTGIGININNSPVVESQSLFNIIRKNSNILDLSNTIIDFIEYNLINKISNQKLVRYLNKNIMKNFKLNHPIFGKNIIDILKVNDDLSLKIKIDNASKNIFFGELV